MWQKIKPFLIALAVTLGIGLLSSALIPDSGEIYQSLNLPPLSPPSWLFPIVWILLYILIGISAGLILRLPPSPERDTALRYYALQLMVNFLWPVIFFRLNAYWLALALILLLFWLTVSTFLTFRPLNKLASQLLIPYLIWIAFATYLNAGVALLN